MKIGIRHLLMDKAGDGGAGGGGGSLLTNNNAGSGGNPPQGQQNNQSQTAQGGGNAGASNGGGGAQGNQTQNWRSALPAELQAEPAIQMFNDIPALVKSYINAQKMVGAEKLTIPGQHATDQDWAGVFEKLGLPKELKDYALTLKEEAGIDKDFTESFKAAAHKAGVLPKQAQKLADWFAEVNKTSEAKIAQEAKTKVENDLKALKTEWGAAYDKNLQSAVRVIREAGSPELIEYLDKSGLGNDVQLIKLLSGVATKYMKEDSAVGGNTGGTPVMTPKDAMTAANKIMADFGHPYHDASHPNHKAAVEEVQAYFQMANPTAKK